MDTSGATTAEASTTAVACIPTGGGACGWSRARARANATYASFVRSAATGTATSSAAITADARVAASALAYLGLLKKETSPGPADSRDATRVISMSPSPSRRQPRRSASSRSVKAGGVYHAPSRLALRRTACGVLRRRERVGHHARDKQRQILEPQPHRDVETRGSRASPDSCSAPRSSDNGVLAVMCQITEFRPCRAPRHDR